MRFKGIGIVLCLLLQVAQYVASTPVMVVVGVIKNPTGAVLTGVEIKVRNQTRGTSVDTSTDANGVYRAIVCSPLDEGAVVEVGDR